MCKKLMFLTSLVALLGLVNAAYAADIDWLGCGPDDSVCTPENWDGNVPGPGDTARDNCHPNSIGCDILIDCDFTVDNLRMPNYEGPDCNRTMDMVSGNVTCNSWRATYKGNRVGYSNILGGTLTVGEGESQCRLGDDGGNNTFCHVTFGGDALVNIASRIRTGDNGGNIFLTFTDNAVVNTDRYIRVGDDGGGELVISGNASITTGLGGGEGDLYVVCRKMSATVDVSGNPEVYCPDEFRLGNPGQAAGKAAVTADMTMSGGTINCDRFLAGWEPDKPDDFSASLTMTGGLIIARDEFRVGEKTTVNLVSSSSGGVISCDGIQIDNGGVVDVNGDGPTDAHILIDGDVLPQVFALRDAGKLTGNGTKQGLRADYGLSNPGKTTVYAAVVDPDKAWDPIPRDTATKVAPEGVVLQWQNGASIGRGFHYVYFDDEPDCVTNTDCNDPAADCLVAIRKAIQPYYDLALHEDPPDSGLFPYAVLDLWTTYYWRVDESSSECWIGYVWTFTTGCELIPGDTNLDCVLNFEDYADVAGTWMQTDYWP